MIFQQHDRVDLERNQVSINNIAIIKLEEKVQETDFVSPICLNLKVGDRMINIKLNI